MIRLLPAALAVDGRERLRAAIGALAGVLLAGLVARWCAVPWGAGVWLVAPMGASAVLLFALPSSPLAQPWPVIGGNVLSTLVGIVIAARVPDLPVAAALAVGVAIGLMFLLRCLHPPGGAAALLAVLTHTVDPKFALFPVLLDAVVLVLAAAAYNTFTGRPYPHPAASTAAPPPSPGSRFTAADLDAALAHYNQVVDVDRDDLERLLHEAEAIAYQRTLGELKCADIMSRELVTARAADTLDAGWRLLHEHSIKALPVVRPDGGVEGILTLADFVRRLERPAQATPMAPSGPAAVTFTGTIGEVMTRHVRVASDAMPVVALLPLFSEGGHHHLPVVDAQARLVGMITQSDVVRALHRAVG